MQGNIPDRLMLSTDRGASCFKMDHIEENKMILENIEEFVMDESRLVTYKWLSYMLGIHVNRSKSLLEEYSRNHNGHVDVVYFVGGKLALPDSTRYEYHLARKRNLSKLKKKFDSLTCCHVYAIQKAPLKDSSALYAADLEKVQEHITEANKWSAIQSLQSDRGPDRSSSRRATSVVEDSCKQEALTEILSEPEKEVLPQRPVLETSSSHKPVVDATTSFFGKPRAKQSKPKQEAHLKESPPQPVKVPAQTCEAADTKDKGRHAALSEKTKSIVAPLTQAFTHAKLKKTETTVASEEIPKFRHSNEKVVSRADSHSQRIDESASLRAPDEKEQTLRATEKKTSDESCKKKRKSVHSSSDSEDGGDDFENFLQKAKGQKGLPEKSSATKEVLTDSDGDSEIIAPTPKHQPLASSKKVCKGESKLEAKKASKQQSQGSTAKNQPPASSKIVSSDETKQSSKQHSQVASFDDGRDSHDMSQPKATSSSESPEVLHGHKRKRGKRRVLKSKTFMNDDGYMVTEKVYEEESFSEGSDGEVADGKSADEQKHSAVIKAADTLEKSIKQMAKKQRTQASVTRFFKKN